MLDQDSDTRASCRLLNSSNDRVRFQNMVLLAGPTATDYESLDSSKTLRILIECEDQHGASVTTWILLPVKGNLIKNTILGSKNFAQFSFFCHIKCSH